ncbi:MAG: glycoside hydrolase family 16 protein [Clostridia bacterium]|nr:glycoside hydrolase family 16 protein [Clostridia bacterium]
MKLDAIMDALKFAYRQKAAVYAVGDFFKNIFAGGFSFKRLFAGILAFFEMFACVLFDKPVTPRGPELDLEGYHLVFCDEFEGNELNMDVWKHRGLGTRRTGFNGESQVSVSNGNLYLTGEYLEDGAYGAGWYTGMISLREHYKQGYFEIRCKCNKDKGFWSAFWIQSPNNPYDHYISQGGVNGAELDIFEAMSGDKILKKNRNSVTQTIHCNGWDDDIENIDSRCLGIFKVGNDIYDEYNTYGLKWTEDEYIFYINGVESARSSFGNGVSQIPEEVIVSLEIPDELPKKIASNKDYSTQMVVDYVKIYQQ